MMHNIEKFFAKWAKEDEENAKQYEDFDDYEILESRGFHFGRLLSSGKTGPTGHLMVWNGNIITEKYGKIWYGDLDITTESGELQEIADEIGDDLYILREHDARFENEYAGMKYWRDKAVMVFIAKCNCKK